MDKFISLLFIFILTTPISALGDKHSVVNHIIPNAKVVGEDRLRYWFWDVYDATLYSENGVWDETKPFALKLSYLRNLKGQDIAKRSVEEIRQQGFQNKEKLSAWYKKMVKLFPDVKAGTELTGIFIPGKITHFYNGNEHIGTFTDTDFGKHFFNIWLGEKTSEPALRRKLLGL